MKLSGGLTVLIGSSDAFGLKDYLNYKYQNQVATGVDNRDSLGLGTSGIADLLINVNQQSPNMGYSDLFQMFAGQSGNKQMVLDNMKDNFMNSAYQSMQNSQLSPLFLQYAKGGNSGNDQVINKENIIYNMMPDPMATIIRLKKTFPDRAKDLLKRMVARGVVTDDPYLPDLLMSGKSDELKDYLFAKQLKTADPIMQTILYKKLGNAGDHAAFEAGAGEKELIQTKLIADRFGDSVNQIAPNDAYLMFKFLELTKVSKVNALPGTPVDKKYINPDVILQVALGTDVAGIKANEFQEKFGVGANDFVCAAHEDAIRVPCMVNQKVVQPGECQAMGCCYNRLSTGSGASKIPVCYHNLLGKIGAGIAQHMIKDSTIEDLFGGELPQLADLQEASNWAEAQMPDVLRRLNKQEGSMWGNPSGQSSWWSNNYNSGSSNFNIYATPAPNTRKFEWKAHGPTAMPNAGELEIPEVGGFLTGDNDDQAVKDLDFIINAHMTKVRGELNQNSYTCQLIKPENMVNCYDNNYEALSQAVPASACQNKGCCFRELNLFDNNPVCYRSLRSGHCDVPKADRGTALTGAAAAADAYWTAHPYRQQCGAPGISRGECLLNPLCCFDNQPRHEGEAFCYRRAGAEQLFDQNTGSMANQCELTDITQRQECFDNTSKFGKLLNRVATEDQCAQAGCCFSQAAADAASSMGVLGSMNLAGPHCFKRPVLQDNAASVANNYDVLDKVPVNALVKVCANDAKWPSLARREWIKDATTGRYVLDETQGTRPLSRQACTDSSGSLIMDRHKCIYEQGCCFDKTSDPLHPWCYKARLVKK